MDFIQDLEQLRQDIMGHPTFAVILITFGASFVGALPVVILLIR
jgi:hypothetical protein